MGCLPLGEYMLPAIRAAACEHSLKHLFARTSIGLGHLGPDAVALGAAALPIKALLSGNAFPTREWPARPLDAEPLASGKRARRLARPTPQCTQKPAVTTGACVTHEVSGREARWHPACQGGQLSRGRLARGVARMSR